MYYFDKELYYIDSPTVSGLRSAAMQEDSCPCEEMGCHELLGILGILRISGRVRTACHDSRSQVFAVPRSRAASSVTAMR